MNNQFDRQQYELPNGKKIFHLNDYETDFLYHEIFNNEVYVQHGIQINEGDVIFDVGANIGLFSLYVKQKCPQCTIYAFEPLPSIYPILKQNLQGFADTVKTYQYGLSDNEEQKTLVYYPGYSVISGFHTNVKRDVDIIASGMKASEEASAGCKINSQRGCHLEYQ